MSDGKSINATGQPDTPLEVINDLLAKSLETRILTVCCPRYLELAKTSWSPVLSTTGTPFTKRSVHLIVS